MGTNYYAKEEPCSYCGRGGDPIHIGKSSAGWVFLLHVIPEMGINSLDDWKRFCRKKQVKIEDEYGKEIFQEELWDIIENRRHTGTPWKSAELFENNAVYGPNGLVRVNLGSNYGCIGYGDGTWDLIEGEFS
jgi:hypothetical protein